MTIATEFHDWQHHGQPGAPYNYESPNLAALRMETSALFGLEGGSGYNVRKIRSAVPDDSDPWSSHAFGAAVDRYYRRLGRARLVAEVLPWLISNSRELHLQAIHDYVGCRIWRAGRTRTTADAFGTWWKPQTPSVGSGMGQASSLWLHLETTETGWHDATPIRTRPGIILPGSATTTTPGGLFVHAKIRRGDVNADVFAAQVILRQCAGFRSLPVTGIFDAATDQATRDFQKARGLYVDGIIGPQTWGTLDKIANG